MSESALKSSLVTEPKAKKKNEHLTPEKPKAQSMVDGMTNFSKASNIGFFTPQKPDSSLLGRKIKSEAKLTLKQAEQWDLKYSEFYNRELSQSLKKEKHLNVVMNMKNKLFPKGKDTMFTL